MTITDMARMLMNADRYQRGAAQPKYPNGAAVSHPDRPYDGLDITGMTAADRKLVSVSKEAEQTVRDMALEDMKKYYGMSGPDGNNLGNFIKSYYKQIPPSDRANASWTLQQIHREEVYRLYDFVRSRVPGWEIGQKFDTSILEDYRQGALDRKDVHSIERNGMGSGHNFSLQKHALPIGEKRKAELTAASLFPEEEVRETEESRARYRKFEEIIRKMHSGKRLTAAEMRFLRRHYPEAAAKADRIQQEIKMLEAQFRACDTAEETDRLYEKVKAEALTRFAQKDSSGLAVLAAVQRMQPACNAEQGPDDTEQKESGAAPLPWQPEQALDRSILENHRRGIDVKA